MTTVSYVGAGTRSTNTNGNITPTLPSGLLDGDLLVAWAEAASSAITFTPPSGWSTLDTIVDSAGGGPTLSIFWKAYASGDTDPLLTKVGSTAGATVLGRVIAYRNAEVTTGPVAGTVYNTGATAGANAGPISGVTVTGDGRALLLAAWGDDYGTAPATPSGWTLVANDTAGATAGVSYHASDQSVVGASSSAVTVTGHPTANATRVGVQIAINEGIQTGSGSLAQTGSGSLSLAPANVAASGSLAQTGSGTASFGATSVAASGALARTGTGTLTLAGSVGGNLTQSGSGSLTLAPTSIVASGTLARAGSGALSLGASSVAASGTLARTGSGSLTLTQALIAVTAVFARSGSGVLSLLGTPAFTVPFARTGTGVLTLIGTAVYRYSWWDGSRYWQVSPVVWDGQRYRPDGDVRINIVADT